MDDPKKNWMRLIVLVLRTMRLRRNSKFVFPRDKVEWFANVDLLRYSSIAMVDDWIASVLSACFRSPLQFNCKLVRYCNIWVSRWTLLTSWSKMSLRFVSPCFSLFPRMASVDFPSPWEGLVEQLLWSSEHCYVHVDDNLFAVRWPLLVDVGWVGLLLKVAS